MGVNGANPVSASPPVSSEPLILQAGGGAGKPSPALAAEVATSVMKMIMDEQKLLGKGILDMLA